MQTVTDEDTIAEDTGMTIVFTAMKKRVKWPTTNHTCSILADIWMCRVPHSPHMANIHIRVFARAANSV